MLLDILSDRDVVTEIEECRCPLGKRLRFVVPASDVNSQTFIIEIDAIAEIFQSYTGRMGEFMTRQGFPVIPIHGGTIISICIGYEQISIAAKPTIVYKPVNKIDLHLCVEAFTGSL